MELCFIPIEYTFAIALFEKIVYICSMHFSREFTFFLSDFRLFHMTSENRLCKTYAKMENENWHCAVLLENKCKLECRIQVNRNKMNVLTPLKEHASQQQQFENSPNLTIFFGKIVWMFTNNIHIWFGFSINLYLARWIIEIQQFYEFHSRFRFENNWKEHIS